MPGETIDFEALAARLSEIDGVRACLLMSRDGLTLGVHPADREESARAVWEGMHSIGDPERGFLTVGDELWIVARRGPYAGIVVAGPSATPGLLLDRLEFSLRAAEELRLREGSAATSPRAEGSRKPRSPLHPETGLAPLTHEPDGSSDAVSAAIQIASMREGPITLSPRDGNGHRNGSKPPELKLRPLETEAPLEPEPDPEPDAEPAPEPDAEPAPERGLDIDLDALPEPEVEIEIRPVPDEEEPTLGSGEHFPLPAGDEREVDPVALAREFKNLFDRPDE
ncbi:MAG TPA: hypothetical protein VF097_01655 [Actinomycetota bacterium]